MANLRDISDSGEFTEEEAGMLVRSLLSAGVDRLWGELNRRKDDDLASLRCRYCPLASHSPAPYLLTYAANVNIVDQSTFSTGAYARETTKGR